MNKETLDAVKADIQRILDEPTSLEEKGEAIAVFIDEVFD